MKIKAIPIKSRTLCDKCRFYLNNECGGIECIDCKINNFKTGSMCYCAKVEDGERCEHFERYDESITDFGRFKKSVAKEIERVNEWLSTISKEMLDDV